MTLIKISPGAAFGNGTEVLSITSGPPVLAIVMAWTDDGKDELEFEVAMVCSIIDRVADTDS
jgi:hypothetical protein